MNKIIIIITLILTTGLLYFLYQENKLPFIKNVPTIAEVRKTPPISNDGKKIKGSTIAKALRELNGDRILYETENYNIEYAPAPDAFFITIKSNDLEQYHNFNQEAEEWFIGQGFTKDDLCKLTVIYTFDPNLRIINFEEKLPSCQG